MRLLLTLLFPTLLLAQQPSKPAPTKLAPEQVASLEAHLDLTYATNGDRTLQRGIQLRNPYVDPVNLMQVDLLRRWRGTGREDRELFEALVASINGIAQGLQSTG